MEAADTEVNNPVSKVIQLLISKAGWGLKAIAMALYGQDGQGRGGGMHLASPRCTETLSAFTLYLRKAQEHHTTSAVVGEQMGF